jgi:hypothetical protein
MSIDSFIKSLTSKSSSFPVSTTTNNRRARGVRCQVARSDRDRNFYENKCAALDRQIDALVYELYELTPDEIAIVEGTIAVCDWM